jgi:hypothetical protein
MRMEFVLRFNYGQVISEGPVSTVDLLEVQRRWERDCRRSWPGGGRRWLATFAIK